MEQPDDGVKVDEDLGPDGRPVLEDLLEERRLALRRMDFLGIEEDQPGDEVLPFELRVSGGYDEEDARPEVYLVPVGVEFPALDAPAGCGDAEVVDDFRVDARVEVIEYEVIVIGQVRATLKSFGESERWDGRNAGPKMSLPVAVTMKLFPLALTPWRHRIGFSSCKVSKKSE